MVRPCDSLLFHLLPDDFDDDPFGALSIEFAVEEALALDGKPILPLVMGRTTW